MPNRDADRPALSRLFGPDLTRLERAWGADAVLVPRSVRGSSDQFADLFGSDAVDELIAERGLRAPFLRVARNGSTLPDSAFTSGGGVGAGIGDQVSDDLVRKQFANGATIVLQGLHRTWTPIKQFSQDLAAELGHPVQVNAYVTPPQSQGFAPHYDVHDVFVLQITGTKRWLMHAPVLPSPLRSQTWDARAADVAARASEEPILAADLAPGDVLYLPRGFIHSARALGGLTIHLTIGLHVWTRHHLAEALLATVRGGLANQADLRSALPLGAQVSSGATLNSDAEAVRAALHAALDTVSTSELAAALLAQSRSSQRPASLGPLGQLADADALAPDTLLHLRPHLAATLDDDGDTVAVRSRAGRCVLPQDTRPALARLLAGDGVPAREFGEHARTLLVEGVGVVA